MNNLKHYILLLEDSTCDILLTKNAFKNTAFVLSVDNKTDFYYALKIRPLDLIVADYKLPSFGHLEALRMSKEENPHIPFVYYTGYTSEENKAEAIKAGADGYIDKANQNELIRVARMYFHLPTAA